MIRAKIEASSLDEFYLRIVAVQVEAHGGHYCAQHTAIEALAAECDSYAELGVNQGATLACALLAGYGTVTGVDRRLEPYREHEGLFREYAEARGASLVTLEQDSLLPIAPVDLLLIDSCHEPAHLRAELAVHAPNVLRYILVHDTTKHPELYAELVHLDGWVVVEQETRGVGYTLVEKT